mmetsp:Transcript_26796/g.81093  ORF Transcript_26796/g.81093 Transcript_26796/m.81093 type:complete len:109 (-) Transcript_26796:1158-1484(-)
MLRPEVKSGHTAATSSRVACTCEGGALAGMSRQAPLAQRINGEQGRDEGEQGQLLATIVSQYYASEIINLSHTTKFGSAAESTERGAELQDRLVGTSPVASLSRVHMS